MRLSSNRVHDIHPSVSLFVSILFSKVSTGNILMRYGGDGMEEGDGLKLLLVKITGALSYHYLEEEFPLSYFEVRLNRIASSGTWRPTPSGLMGLT